MPLPRLNDKYSWIQLGNVVLVSIALLGLLVGVLCASVFLVVSTLRFVTG